MKKKIKKAFSLIELLISLIIISLIAAAFTPVLSQKLVSGKVALNTKGVKIDCAQKYGEDCVMCNDKACLWCTTYINIPKGQYVDPALGCERKFCKDKYGETCTSCTKDWCTGCKGGFGFNPSSHTCYICLAPTSSSGDENPCRTCDNGYEYQDANEQINCKICDTANGYFPNSDRKGCTQVKCNRGYKRDGSSCKICDAGYYQSSDNYSGTTCSYCGGTKQYSSSGASGCSSCPTGQIANSYHTGCVQKTCSSGQNLIGDDCITPAAPAPTPDSPEEPSGPSCPSDSVLVQSGSIKFCMKKFNAGDSGGPSFPASVKTSGNSSSSNHRCYQGKTADNCALVSGFSYDPCNRTVCDWYAANDICASIGWQLPTTAQMQALSSSLSSVQFIGSSGLQLCEYKKNKRSPYCSGIDTGRSMFSGGGTSPRTVWGEQASSSEGKTIRLGDDAATISSSSKKHGYSVRCVKPL